MARTPDGEERNYGNFWWIGVQSHDCNVFSITTLDGQLRSRALCVGLLCYANSKRWLTLARENIDLMGSISMLLSFV